MARWIARWVVLAMVGACGPQVVSGDGDGSGSSGSAVDTSGAPSTVSVGTSVGTTASTSNGPDPTSAGATTEGTDTGVLFVVPPDVPEGDECSIFEQNCPDGQKCMPWANDGGNQWNATRCTEVVEDARAIGESCEVVDSAVSGIDDCTFGAMCFYVDGATGIGECVAFCTGSESDGMCDPACTQCTVSAVTPLALCLPSCDPLAPDCGPNQGCYPGQSGFTCSINALAGAAGEPCEYVNACDPGLVCMPAEQVPGCTGVGCCAPVCDTAAADPCDAVLPGSTCVPWDDSIPEGCASATLGVCGA